MIKLYTYALSPYGMKVYWALRMKSLPFELIYVSLFDQKEIAFTEQQMVPVLSIGDEWKLDSTPIVHWLDEKFPDNNLTGVSPRERSAIAEIDEWASEQYIPAFFRHCTDSHKNLVGMFDVGLKLASTMDKTSGGVPKYMYPFWPFVLRRRAPFVAREVEKVADFGSCADADRAMLEVLEGYLAESRFLGRESSPTIADIAIYAQVHCALSLRMKGILDVRTSGVVHDWIRALEQAFPPRDASPELYPNMQQHVA